MMAPGAAAIPWPRARKLWGANVSAGALLLTVWRKTGNLREDYCADVLASVVSEAAMAQVAAHVRRAHVRLRVGYREADYAAARLSVVERGSTRIDASPSRYRIVRSTWQ